MEDNLKYLKNNKHLKKIIKKLQKRKADRNSPDSRKRGKQALIEKVRAERQQELVRTGVILLPNTPLLPRTGEVEDA